MSTPCTTCGLPIDDAHDRCPACGALTPPAVAKTETLDALDAGGDAPPWSIPIREPRSGPVEPASGRRTTGIAVLGVLVIALTVLVGVRMLDGDGADTASGDTAPPASPEADESGGIDAAAVRAETTTTTAPRTSVPATTAAPESTGTAGAPTTAAPTTAVARPAATTTTTTFAARTGPNGTGSVPALSTGFRGWLAQLKSVPYEAGTDGLAEDWERERRSMPGVVAARSDDWAAFRDGFWVLVDPGPFASADDVRAFCSSAGLDGDGECLPRELRG